MRKLLLVLALGLTLVLCAQAVTLAAPILADTEGGTLGVYAESIFGLIYYGGVTYTILDGCGLGVGTFFNGDAAFNLFTVNGTVSLGPVVLDAQAVTGGDFTEYFGMVGGYLKFDLGPVVLYPGVGMLFADIDIDNDGTDEIASQSDPFFAAELQFKAGDFTAYADIMKAFGESQVFMGRIGVGYSF